MLAGATYADVDDNKQDDVAVLSATTPDRFTPRAGITTFTLIFFFTGHGIMASRIQCHNIRRER